MDNLSERTLGRYRIGAQLGRGGMATVYRAIDPAFRRTVAIKVLRTPEDQREEFGERFRREARAIARLQHPHILPVYDVGEEDGYGFLVMQYVDGGTLADALRAGAGRSLDVPALTALLRPIAAALDYAHAQGVVHRDVKPTNILLTAEGHQLLADFGLAKAYDRADSGILTAFGMVVGSPEYMAPEQAQGLPLDGRADLYSLGVICYEALTGRTPFRAETPTDTPLAIALRQVTTPPPTPRLLNPAIDPAVELVLMRALAKEPAHRFPTCMALCDALDFAHGEQSSIAAAEDTPTVLSPRGPLPLAEPVPPATPPPIPASPPWYQRRGALAIAGGAVAAILIVIASLGLLLRAAAGTPDIASGNTIAAPTDPPSPTVAAARTVVPTVAPTAPVATSIVATGTSSLTPTPSPSATVRSPTVPAQTPTANAQTPVAVVPTAESRPREVILFASHRAGTADLQIYRMNPDGSEQEQLAFTRGHAWGPKIAPDGGTFVFSAVAPGEGAGHSVTGSVGESGGNHDIYAAAPDASWIVKLTFGPSWDNAWAWSPDGRWVTFATDRDGNWELYKMDRQGRMITRLTDHPGQDGWPSWTPDGNAIVFASDRETPGLSQIYIMDADGGNARRLHYSEAYDTFPAVSPDGATIAYSSQIPNFGEGEIYAMDIDGSNPRRLTSTVALNSEPAWSPSGDRIAFTSDRDGNFNIWVMNADGGEPRRLTDDPGDDVTPNWGYIGDVAGSPAPPSSVTVTLNPQNNSGQSGTAVLTDLDDGTTRVVESLTGGPAGVEQPTHIHRGTCSSPDPTPRFPLTNAVNGASETTVPVPLADLLATPHVVIVHKSIAEGAIYFACGEIGGTIPPATTTVTLNPQNNSGQSGTATLTALGDGTTRIVESIAGGPAGVEQPTHIHQGTCSGPTPTPLYPLANVVDGRSETIAPVALADLLATPHVIIVHKSIPEGAIYVACGEIGPAGAAAQPVPGALGLSGAGPAPFRPVGLSQAAPARDTRPRTRR